MQKQPKIFQKFAPFVILGHNDGHVWTQNTWENGWESKFTNV